MSRSVVRKIELPGVPVVAQRKRIQLGTIRLWVRSLATFSGLKIWHCHELWCRPAATALIRPLPWEPPYARDVALKIQGKKKKVRRLLLQTS